MVSEKQILALVERFEHKLKQLLVRYNESRQQILLLEEENAALQESLREEQKQVLELRRKLASIDKTPVAPIKKSTHTINLESNSALLGQLDTYIKEVDECIAHLSALS